jgi:hypothetical protein
LDLAWGSQLLPGGAAIGGPATTTSRSAAPLARLTSWWPDRTAVHIVDVLSVLPHIEQTFAHYVEEFLSLARIDKLPSVFARP